MLTIKNVLPNNDEEVFTARRLTFSPARVIKNETGQTGHPTQLPDEIFAETDTPTKDVVVLDKGTVYVMNDNGRTVATYHLSYPEPNDEPLMAFGSSD